jgi:ABC-type iron transport system FetAB ATPase subunit
MKNETYLLQDILITKNGRDILSIPRLAIYAGETTAVLGSSGAGKSTLLKLLHLVETPTKGVIHFEGKEVSFPSPQLLKRKIGMIFQRPEFLTRSIEENINFPSFLRKEDHQKTINDLVEKLNLTPLLTSVPGQLSGGELQRAALARILSYNPEIILLDEPTSDLDPKNISLIEKLLFSTIDENSTVVWVTHHIKQALRVADRIIIVADGEITLDIKVSDWDEATLPQDVLQFLQHH